MLGSYLRWRIGWQDPTCQVASHDQTRARNFTLRAIDKCGFDWLVVAAAGSALFTNSYNLSAINFILPAVQYLYYANDRPLNLLVNELTLSGLVVGQLLFGFLADKYGRRKLYGYDLVIVMVSAIGTSQASDGRDGSMSLLSWVLFWRFIMGLGIGAAIPLSAVITAEFAAVRSRPRMMATVFLMQTLGQLASALVSLLVTIGLKSQYGDFPEKVLDQIWRIVLGVGAFPALIAMLLRFGMPESPRYNLDVVDFRSHDVPIGQVETMGDNLSYPLSELQVDFPGNDVPVIRGLSRASTETGDYRSMNQDQYVNRSTNTIEALPRHSSIPELKQYFLVEGNWRYLLGTSFCWFCVNFALWCLGTNNLNILAWLWNQSSTEDLPIYSQIGDYAKRVMIIGSVGAIFGILVLLMVINISSRKGILILSLTCLALIYLVMGSILGTVSGTTSSPIIIVLYALCQFFSNFGPNTGTYIISAEIFPTRYRATCHGISAAAGTIGSMVGATVASLFAPSAHIRPNINGLRWLFVSCSPLLILAAGLASAWLPALQSPRLESEISQRPQDNSLVLISKTLEQLGRGIAGAKIDGDVIGISRNFKLLLVRLHIVKA